MYYINKLKALIPKTLLNRFILIILLPNILNQTIITYIFLERHWNSVNYNMLHSLLNEIKLMIDAHLNYDKKLLEQISNNLDIKYNFLPKT